MRPRLQRAPKARFIRTPASVADHRKAGELAKELGIEKPTFFWSHDAQEAIERMEAMVRQPVLAGFAASTGAGK